jgi:hypothetical protein
MKARTKKKLLARLKLLTKGTSVGQSWPERTLPAGWECRSAPVTRSTIDMIASANRAVEILANDPQPPRVVFMRELALMELGYFEWFYLLTTLLALKDQPPANAPPPQAASDVSA